MAYNQQYQGYGQQDYNNNTGYINYGQPAPYPGGGGDRGGGGGGGGYSDPYATPQPYASANSYPPPPADYDSYNQYPNQPYQHGGGGGAGYGGYSTPDVDEKSARYGNMRGGADSDVTVSGGPYDAKPREGFTPSHQTRGSVAAQMAAEGAIPEKAGLRMWRSDEHTGAFTQGGKKRCCGRCCCCTIIIVLLLLVGIIASFLLWVRPPNITFNGIESPTNGREVSLVNSGFNINFNLNIGVTNPNFFGASFTSIEAKAFYPTNKTSPLGGGILDNVNIKSHSNTTIHFPFQVNYTAALDPSYVILTDLAQKCGFIGNTKSKISVDYTLTLRLKVVAITISPSFSSSTSFDCPLSESDIASVLGTSSGSISSVLGSLTGSGSSKTTRDLVELRSLPAVQEVENRVLDKRDVAVVGAGAGAGYGEWKRRLEAMVKRWVNEA